MRQIMIRYGVVLLILTGLFQSVGPTVSAAESEAASSHSTVVANITRGHRWI